MLASTSSAAYRSRLPKKQINAHWLNRWLAVLSIGLFTCSLAGRFLGRFYFFELFSHFTIQYQWLSYGFIGLWFLYWLIYWKEVKPALSVLAIVSLIGTAYLNQTPWIPGDYDSVIPSPKGDVRVVHANVLYAREEYATTVAMLKQKRSDLYVLQEMTPDKIRFVTAQVAAEFPYWFACPSKQQVWTLVGSRTAFQIDLPLARKLHIISLTTQVRGRAIELVTVHPHTPVIPSWFRERNAQLAYAAHKTRYNARPTILIGDFNISPFSPIYEELFKPDEGRMKTGQKGVLVAARQIKTQPTWPSFLPPMMIPIDHAFVNGGFTPLSFRTLDQEGSDHRAIVVDLKFR
ncbi:endonuclease/exonuclease/phosphatase family protein [Spirosoma aureum]|uniref:Endonuclease/exonuclease/phosphatase family protein n=1 Tax=Spirosoma aureum TaxID=2692134 RepID=A0A6G9AM05_9BACT|nr:endonuclease/exonuclease/phosphatase family protein [Spirosoma aureum]QIP13366.1 endonuclease/exonuclease/phosphatase family protein [Spirosoma aureum]